MKKVTTPDTMTSSEQILTKMTKKFKNIPTLAMSPEQTTVTHFTAHSLLHSKDPTVNRFLYVLGLF